MNKEAHLTENGILSKIKTMKNHIQGSDELTDQILW